MWVSDTEDAKLYAYRMSDGARDSAKDFDTLSAAGNNNPFAIWSDGATMWVSDSEDAKLYAYRMSDGARDSAKDFDTLRDAGNNSPTGIWSDGATMWVSDDVGKLYAYEMSYGMFYGTRDSAKDFDTLRDAGHYFPSGIWSDGTTMWVANDSAKKLYAYRMSDRARDSAKDFDTLRAAGNNSPTGIWSDGATMWVVDIGHKVYSYNAPVSIVLSKSSLTVAEGDTTGRSYTVKLSHQPSEEVTVTITGHAGTDLTPDETTLTFSTTTWNVEQTVTVTAAGDPDGDDDFEELLHTASGGEYADVSSNCLESQ